MANAYRYGVLAKSNDLRKTGKLSPLVKAAFTADASKGTPGMVAASRYVEISPGSEYKSDR